MIPRRPSASTVAALTAAGLDADDVSRVVATALAEDLGAGADVTTNSTIPADARATARVVARESGRIAGVPVALAVFDAICDRPEVSVHVADGADVTAGTTILTVTADTRGLLTAERTALNLLGHLSGVATATAAWARAIDGTGARVRDTRKTLPGLRALQKYAVRRGGGVNHRMSLSDAALVKDNHVAAAGSVAEAFRLVRAAAPGLPIEVEVDTLEQLREVLAAGADVVLLDNMDTATTAVAVGVARAVGRPVVLESSGGLTLERAREVAATGVDYLSVGALTHSVRALDVALDLDEISG